MEILSLRQTIALALSGLPLGAMYALQATGVVIIYKTSGVFNFAQGAIGMTAAYLASGIGISWGVPVVPAVILAVGLGSAIGVLIERVTIRPVEGQLQRTIVTLGWLLGLQGMVKLFFGADAGRQTLSLFPSGVAISVDSIALAYGWDQVGVIVVAVGVSVGLGYFFKTQAFGAAMRAVADNPEGARLLGIKVDRVTVVSWALGAGIAALSGILVAPLLGTLDTVGLVVFTIQSLAAALVGRLSSLPLTFAGGVVLGMSQPVLIRMFDISSGGSELIALLVVLGALLFRKQVGRGDQGGGGLPPVSIPPLPTGQTALGLGAGVAIAAVAAPLIFGLDSSFDLASAMGWALAVLSLVMLAGVAGQISLCQAVFMAVGGYTAGIAFEAGVPFLLAIPIGGLGAAVAAVLVGLPALRLRGLELAIATLSLSFAADRFFFAFEPLVGPNRRRDLARPGFTDRLVEVPDGLNTKVVTDWRPYAFLTIVVFIIVAFGVASLRRARTGAAFTALRSSSAATSAMGFSVTGVKLKGFALSGFIAGVGGVMFGGLTNQAGSAAFDFSRSITLLAYTVIAGIGSVPGALLGGAIVTFSTLSFGSDGSSVTAAATVDIVTAVALIAVVRFAPQGLAGAAGSMANRVPALGFLRPGAATTHPVVQATTVSGATDAANDAASGAAGDAAAPVVQATTVSGASDAAADERAAAVAPVVQATTVSGATDAAKGAAGDGADPPGNRRRRPLVAAPTKEGPS